MERNSGVKYTNNATTTTTNSTSSTGVDAWQWQKGAVRRLASIYESIEHVRLRNVDLIADVRKALRDSATSLKGRQTSAPSARRSRRSSLESASPNTAHLTHKKVPSGSEGCKPLGAEVVPPKSRMTTPTPDFSSASTTDATTPGPSPLSQVPNPPSLVPISPLNACSPSMPPTPPASPPDFGRETMRHESLLSISDNQSMSLSPHLISPTLDSEPSEIQDNASILLSPPLHPSTQTSAEDNVTNPSSYTITTTKSNNNPTLYIPKIRLRDFDTDTKSREISFSSTTSLVHPPSSPSSLTTAYSTLPCETDTHKLDRIGINNDINESDEEELTAYLDILRKQARKVLEEDTSTLVDALRSFINTLRGIDSSIFEAQGQEDRDRGVGHNSCGSALSGKGRIRNTDQTRQSEGEKKRRGGIYDLVRTELREIRKVVREIKEPRASALTLAETGPLTMSGEFRGEEWGKWKAMSDEERVRILWYSIIKSKVRDKGSGGGTRTGYSIEEDAETLERLLAAVVGREANAVFLAKVRSWEEGVEKLERQFGGVLH